MFYQEAKTARSAVVGTIMPWTGGLTNIPPGWILCDGGVVDAADYPLLTQAIGNTYDALGGSITGSFPSYSGTVKLPDLNEKTLMDIESSYFAPVANGGTGRAADIDSDALTLISPIIGDHVDNGVTISPTDVTVDVLFNINAGDRTGYSGKITGNTKEDGEGVATVYIGPRKLGRKHVKRHNHPGTYRTLDDQTRTLPGRGVSGYENIKYTLYHSHVDNEGGSDQGDTYYFGWSSDSPGDGNAETVDSRPGIVIGDAVASNPTSQEIDYMMTWPANGDYAPDGHGGGTQGVVIAHVQSESPPVNLKPKQCLSTPISTQFKVTNLRPEGAFLDQNRAVPAAARGGTLNIPQGFTNYYDDSNQTASQLRDTLMSHIGLNFTNTDPGGDFIEAHDHGEFDVEFDSSGLRPNSSIVCEVNLPATVNVDNTQNEKALQIDVNIAQPTLSCIYIIRAY
jgi:hypothetical protein